MFTSCHSRHTGYPQARSILISLQLNNNRCIDTLVMYTAMITKVLRLDTTEMINYTIHSGPAENIMNR